MSHNNHQQNHIQAPERRKHDYTKAMKIDVVEIKETLIGALKPTEDVLSLPRVNIISPYSRASVDV